MAFWAGIDEAGYGPLLGPLVVAGSAFRLRDKPGLGVMWNVLQDAVSPHARGRGGRLVINDSKRLYTPSRGLKLLEEGVLGALQVMSGGPVERAADLFSLLRGEAKAGAEPAPWFAGAGELALPVASNQSAISSKADILERAMRTSGTGLLAMRACLALPAEFNRIVARTGNKSLLLFQKTGLIMQHLWRRAEDGESYMAIDRHGGRKRYRRLLKDVFPECGCDVLREAGSRSDYRIHNEARALVVSFLKSGDQRALPVALGSMVAKYVRELYMLAFNRYWSDRVEGLKPTAGYGRDARRFLKDIGPALRRAKVDVSRLARAL